MTQVTFELNMEALQKRTTQGYLHTLVLELSRVLDQNMNPDSNRWFIRVLEVH